MMVVLMVWECCKTVASRVEVEDSTCILSFRRTRVRLLLNAALKKAGSSSRVSTLTRLLTVLL